MALRWVVQCSPSGVLRGDFGPCHCAAWLVESLAAASTCPHSSWQEARVEDNSGLANEKQPCSHLVI